MANPMIKKFTTLALSDQWIASSLTYNEITSAVVGTARTYDATDKTVLGNWSSVEGSAAYDDGSGKQVIERFGGLNCALEQPILKLGDRVTGPDGLFYYVTSAPQTSSALKRKYSLNNIESLAGGSNRNALG